MIASLQCQVYGPSVEFPFRIKEQRSEHCGYPEFELTCKDGDTILQLPSVGSCLFLTSYSTQSISDEKQCLAEFILGFNPSNSSSFTSSSPFHNFCKTKNYMFSSCSIDVASDTGSIHRVPCLTHGLHTVVFMESSFDLAMLPESCNVTATIVVPNFAT
ncbi:hypothetical protein NE237_030826 [Protea cynaroides]|uniref:RING-type E3 ubiquitin transferase n=1 Tax=Protea cynaroides TaxID=273540 RepID=A0A9Q0GYM0_9MAGN|nr:hypothetical protein NE237_030826 [Protea cynaroides]